MILALLLGCVSAPRVVPVDFVLAERGDWTPLGARAAAGLAHDLERRRLVEVVLQGRTATADDLATLPEDVAGAAYAVSARPRPYQHLDLRFEVTTDGVVQQRCLTVRLGDRVLQLDWLPLRPAPPLLAASASAVAREAVRRRHGLGELVDGSASWSESELAIVDAAMAALEPEVRALVAGMPLVRLGRSHRAPDRELAWFDPRTEPPTIEVYDLAFADVSGAVGPVDALEPLAAMTLVHELGHVLADAPLRQAWVDLARDPDDAVRMKAFKDLGRRGPVVDAWRGVRDHRSPTPYGARDAHESFAEAYALHRLDPEALAEVMPEASAWFEQDGHLRAAGLVD